LKLTVIIKSENSDFYFGQQMIFLKIIVHLDNYEWEIYILSYGQKYF
jgi:hypothetical protein